MRLGRPLVGVGTPPTLTGPAVPPLGDGLYAPQVRPSEMLVRRRRVALHYVAAPGLRLDAAQLGSAHCGYQVTQALNAGWSVMGSVMHGISLPSAIGGDQ
jgi:hypothetical protein